MPIGEQPAFWANTPRSPCELCTNPKKVPTGWPEASGHPSGLRCSTSPAASSMPHEDCRDHRCDWPRRRLSVGTVAGKGATKCTASSAGLLCQTGCRWKLRRCRSMALASCHLVRADANFVAACWRGRWPIRWGLTRGRTRGSKEPRSEPDEATLAAQPKSQAWEGYSQANAS